MHMDPHSIEEQFAEQQQKLERIYASVEKTRKYFLWSLVAQLLFFFIPLIGLIFVVPFFLATMSRGLDGLL